MPPELDPNERFRQRRDAARRRKYRLRRTVALVALIVVAALIALGATVVAGHGSSDHNSAAKTTTTSKPKKKAVTRTPLPDQVRGVHVTMALANEPGKLDEYLKIRGLTALELDVKDENGKVGFLMPASTLARKVGASQPYYKAGVAAGKARKAGIYLIGRVVTFEDPTLTAARPDLAIRTTSGGVWTNNAGLGWANPYDKRVWDYVVGIGERAAKAGFDEIQFDYVRFPSDGPIENAVFPHKVAEPMGWTIARFVHYATQQPPSAWRPRLGGRLRALGNARPRDRPGTGPPREVRRRCLPDDVSVALQRGRVQPPRPERDPRRDRRLLAPRLQQRHARPQGGPHSLARGLLSDERAPTARGGAGADRRGAPSPRQGLPALEPGGRLHGTSPQVRSRHYEHRRTAVTKTYEELKTRLSAIHDLHMARAILGWDQHTKMPPKGGEVRAEQLGTLDRFSHELFIDDEIGQLLEDVRDYEEKAGYDSNDGSLIRITRRDYEKAKRVPGELRAEMTRAGAMALPAWIEAREKSDFSIFLPHLKKNLELTHRYVDCFEGMDYESEYDVLLDDFDEGLTAGEVRTVFDELKRELVPLIAQIAENADGSTTRRSAATSRSRSSAPSRSTCSSGWASTTRRGGSTRPCTRSR